jgi:hypothetical protein
MTLDQLIAEVAAQPTQVKAFTVLMECLQSEIKDASAGNTPPPSVQSKYDSVFDETAAKANEILAAIETNKPALEPIRPAPASSPSGPKTSAEPVVFVDKPKTEPTVAPAAIPSPFGEPAPAPLI